ncbi:hypothetical protein RhiJN_28907 [Ceratobasidium sp. AG-Ba]|nr:hypothetical protein RhiJN_28907 [Ceratobasidium sp. AG-Ba]
MSPGKIALPSTPKLESQSMSEEPSSKDKAIGTRRLVKGAVLGAAAWFVLTGALRMRPGYDNIAFAPWGWGRTPHHHEHSWPVDCSIWDDFDFDAPLKLREGPHPHPHWHPRPPMTPDMPTPPVPPHAPNPPHLPVPPRAPAPPGAPAPPPPPPPHEPRIFNISNSASEIRLASMGFLGHGVVRVESGTEDVDTIQVEVQGAHGRICALKDEDNEIIGVGLVGYMRGRGRRGRGRDWWPRWGQSKSKRGEHQFEESQEEELVEIANEIPCPAPPHDDEFSPSPPGNDLPPPPPPPGREVPPPPHRPPHPHPPLPCPHPHYPHHAHAPIVVTLRVPSSHLPALRTRLPFFTHEISAPSASSFANLDIATRDAHIGLDSVVVREGGNATVRSVNAPIRGEVRVQGGWAFIETKNAVVDVEVAMSSGDDKEVGVELKSSNAPIIASLDLQGSAKDRFTVFCATSNAYLALNVTSQARGSLLFLTGQTSNAPASVQLHPNYEGVFELTSSVVAPAVVEEKIEDRKVEVERVRGRVAGSVWYEDRKLIREGGEVVVSTSNAPNTLLL